MQESESKSYKTFFVKLESGRVLGPIGLDRIRKLIKKKHIQGSELARENHASEWKPVGQYPEILALLVELLEKGTFNLAASWTPGGNGVLPGADLPSPKANEQNPVESPARKQDPDATLIASAESLRLANTAEEKTQIGVLVKLGAEGGAGAGASNQSRAAPAHQTERTVLLSRPPDPEAQAGAQNQGQKQTLWGQLRGFFLVLVFSYFAYDLLIKEPEKTAVTVPQVIRPKLPEIDQTRLDPTASMRLYDQGLKLYIADTVAGYRGAAERFSQSVSADPNNVKALAMLASSYINLIDSTNKDENYFDVLSRLIDMSRAKSIELPETVIADVEFYITVNKPEAAQARVIEYTKDHSSFGVEMYYYLALSFFARGDFVNAARFIEQFPDAKAFSPKIFYLRGQVAEKLKDFESAINQYNKAIALSESHVRSRLRLAWILSQQGKLGNASAHLTYALNHIELLSPKELSEVYFLNSQLLASQSKWKEANVDIEKAVKLDPENHTYLLEYYTLKAKIGGSISSVQSLARMYYFLGEGERMVRDGKYHDALVPFLQARESDDKSPLPLVKIGDMFSYLHDVENAKKNYKLAADRAPNDIQIWSKYIKTLIQSYEWDDATRAMDRFRKMDVSQSAIDKAAADIYQQQGRYVEAQMYYKKAMSRSSIDPSVYIAYAKSLMATKNFKDAPFFFALALRFDPLNVEAVIGTAKCVAETESIEKAIAMLQDELKRGASARAEYLAAIAELQMQKGNWELAAENIKQAIQVNPDYPYSWKLQGNLYMGRDGSDKSALDQALKAYKSYSDRNLSDPSGYLERYKIYVKRIEFEKAKEELTRIFEIYPKYPNLHYYLGALYALQGNHKVAIDEFKTEIQNNPMNFQALIAYGKELLEVNDPKGNQEALNSFTKAMQISPSSAEAKQNAGWANFRLQNYTAAIALIKEAVQLDPANPAHYRRLGLVYRDSGDISSACAAFKKYIEMEPDAPDKASFQGCF